MTTIHVDLKTAGQTLPEQQALTACSSVKIVFHNFAVADVLEDYLETMEAAAALADPTNQERVSWEVLKARLGL
jgi:hypothetical protein